MGFDKSEVLRCIRKSGNIPLAMVRYISRNGCSEFRCRKCPLGLVCDHYPSSARGVAMTVLVEAESVMRDRKDP